MKLFVFSFLIAILGAALGVLVALKIGEREAPCSAIANLFCLSYKPFTFVISHFMRFILYLLIASLGFFLPLSALYPAIALFFYGKYIAQIATFAFLTDSIASAVLSLLIVSLPIFIAGVICLFFIYCKAFEWKICHGERFNAANVSRFLPDLAKCLIFYFLALASIFLVICGLIYIVVIAV